MDLIQRIFLVISLSILLLSFLQSNSQQNPPVISKQEQEQKQDQSSPKQPMISKDDKNTAPVINIVKILPANVSCADPPHAFFKVFDKESDSISYKYKWYKNGTEIVGAFDPVLAPTEFMRGDEIFVEVTPSDGRLTGKTMRSESVTINNAAPVIDGLVRFLPHPFHTNNDLQLNVKVKDADNDPITLHFKWYVNQQLVYEGSDPILSHTFFKKGDNISIKIIPDDGINKGNIAEISNISVSNAPPQITSQVPTNFDKNKGFNYQVMGTDPDNDKLTYSLVNAPEGMHIDAMSGLLQWPSSNDLSEDEYNIEIKVVDSEGGEAIQSFKITIGTPQQDL